MSDWLAHVVPVTRFYVLFLAFIAFGAGWMTGRIVMAEKIKHILRLHD